MIVRSVILKNNYSIISIDDNYLIRAHEDGYEVYKVGDYQIIDDDDKYDKIYSNIFEYLTKERYPPEIKQYIDEDRMMNAL